MKRFLLACFIYLGGFVITAQDTTNWNLGISAGFLDETLKGENVFFSWNYRQQRQAMQIRLERGMRLDKTSNLSIYAQTGVSKIRLRQQQEVASSGLEVNGIQVGATLSNKAGLWAKISFQKDLSSIADTVLHAIPASDLQDAWTGEIGFLFNRMPLVKTRLSVEAQIRRPIEVFISGELGKWNAGHRITMRGEQSVDINAKWEAGYRLDFSIWFPPEWSEQSAFDSPLEALPPTMQVMPYVSCRFNNKAKWVLKGGLEWDDYERGIIYHQGGQELIGVGRAATYTRPVMSAGIVWDF